MPATETVPPIGLRPWNVWDMVSCEHLSVKRLYAAGTPVSVRSNVSGSTAADVAILI